MLCHLRNLIPGSTGGGGAPASAELQPQRAAGAVPGWPSGAGHQVSHVSSKIRFPAGNAMSTKSLQLLLGQVRLCLQPVALHETACCCFETGRHLVMRAVWLSAGRGDAAPQPAIVGRSVLPSADTGGPQRVHYLWCFNAGIRWQWWCGDPACWASRCGTMFSALWRTCWRRATPWSRWKKCWPPPSRQRTSGKQRLPPPLRQRTSGKAMLATTI